MRCLRVDPRVRAEVEADRLEEDGRGTGRVEVGGGQDTEVFLDDRRGRVVDLRGLVLLDGGPLVVPVFDEERGRVDRCQACSTLAMMSSTYCWYTIMSSRVPRRTMSRR